MLNQTISFTSLSNRIYGDNDFNITATASSSLPVSFATTGACSNTGSTVSITGVGSCTVTASQAGNTTYAAATDVPRTFTVAKKDITATAENKSRVYGATNPTATFIYSDSATGIDTSPISTFSGNATSAVGTAQTITCTGGTDDKYNITSCITGTLTITQATTTTTITSDNPDSSAIGNVVKVNFTVTPASGTNLLVM